MNEALQYVIDCADSGDLAALLEKYATSKKFIYHGDNGLDLHFSNGKIIKVFHDGILLKIVEL